MNQTASQLVSDIAARIEKSLISLDGALLPTREQLAKQYSVSHSTISSAAKLLKTKGLIELYPGKRMRRAGMPEKSDESVSRQTAAARLFDMLKNQIADGDLPAGHYLPKLGYYVLERRVTNRTVRAAYSMLVEQGLAFCQGKRWIVGPEPRRLAVSSPRRRPFILILQKKGTSWSGLCGPRTEAFTRIFSAEAARCDIQLISAYTTVDGAPTRLQMAGRDQIHRFIRTERNRYAGTLLVDKADEIPDMVAWVDLLCAMGKPVCWFDPLDQPQKFHQGPPIFTRCHFAEERAIAIALDHLTTLGHRTIAFINLSSEQWRINRFQSILQKSQRRTPQIKIITTSPAQFLWADRTSSEVDTIFKGLWTEVALVSSGVFDSLAGEILDCKSMLPEAERALLPVGPFTDIIACIRASVLGLFKLPYKLLSYLSALYLYYSVNGLLDQGVTALLIPCDQDARSFHTWLSMTGVAIPERVSMLSFDNYQTLHPLLPVSTIDFGFGHLGYAAFHFILGDVPVSKDRKGDIGARPFLVNRGSVDVPWK